MSCSVVETMEQPLTLIRQTGNLCLLYSVLNALPNDNDRCKFVRSDDPYDVSRVVEFIQGLDHHKENEPGFPFGITCKDINWYLLYLKREGILESFVMKNIALNLPVLLSRKRRNNRGKAFIVCGHTTTDPNIRKRVVKCCTGPSPFDEWKAFRDRMRDGTARVRKCDYSTHAIAIRFTMDNQPVLLDPGRKVPFLLTSSNFGSEISKSIFDYYVVCKFSLKFV